MPDSGLPMTLECMLNSALQEMTLSSFKVEGRGNQTVVVLRPSSKISDHTPIIPLQNATFRRKCPSQLNQDKRSAEAYRANRVEQASEPIPSPSGLFLPTPPSFPYAVDLTNGDPMDRSVPCVTITVISLQTAIKTFNKSK